MSAARLSGRSYDPDPRSALLASGRYSEVKNPAINLPLDVLDFDIIKGLAELGEFACRSSKFGSQRVVRVEPEEPYPVELMIGDQTLPAKLAGS